MELSDMVTIGKPTDEFLWQALLLVPQKRKNAHGPAFFPLLAAAS
jgi:hypothetical protein